VALDALGNVVNEVFPPFDWSAAVCTRNSDGLQLKDPSAKQDSQTEQKVSPH
jgi:hypothetical protein